MTISYLCLILLTLNIVHFGSSEGICTCQDNDTEDGCKAFDNCLWKDSKCQYYSCLDYNQEDCNNKKVYKDLFKSVKCYYNTIEKKCYELSDKCEDRDEANCGGEQTNCKINETKDACEDTNQCNKRDKLNCEIYNEFSALGAVVSGQTFYLCELNEEECQAMSTENLTEDKCYEQTYGFYKWANDKCEPCGTESAPKLCECSVMHKDSYCKNSQCIWKNDACVLKQCSDFTKEGDCKDESVFKVFQQVLTNVDFSQHIKCYWDTNCKGVNLNDIKVSCQDINDKGQCLLHDYCKYNDTNKCQFKPCEDRNLEKCNYFDSNKQENICILIDGKCKTQAVNVTTCSNSTDQNYVWKSEKCQQCSMPTSSTTSNSAILSMILISILVWI